MGELLRMSCAAAVVPLEGLLLAMAEHTEETCPPLGLGSLGPQFPCHARQQVTACPLF